jgi:DNA-binding transcriptional ArsR family regulator
MSQSVVARRGDSGMTEKRKPDIDRVFQALGDATRRAMLDRLSAGPMSVSRLAEPFQMSLAAIVQHLQLLEEAGLAQTEKVGRVRSCRVDSAGLDAAAEWLAARRPEWERKLDLLGQLLADSDEEPES